MLLLQASMATLIELFHLSWNKKERLERHVLKILCRIPGAENRYCNFNAQRRLLAINPLIRLKYERLYVACWVAFALASMPCLWTRVVLQQLQVTWAQSKLLNLFHLLLLTSYLCAVACGLIGEKKATAISPSRDNSSSFSFRANQVYRLYHRVC